MKKTKLIALTLVVAVMIMGAGYASWTDLTQINGTVTTGVLDIQVKDVSSRAHKYTTSNATEIDDNTIKFEVGKLYPTVYNKNDKNTFGQLNFTIENEGNVPVKLDNVVFTPTDSTSELWQHLGTAVSIDKVRVRDGIIDYETRESLTGPTPIVGDLNELDTLIANSGLKNVVLNPDEALIFGYIGKDEIDSYIGYYLKDSAPNTTQNSTTGFTLTINWKQANID